MSLRGCLNIAVNAGTMTRERAEELIRTAEAFATEEAEAAQRMIDTAFTESALRRKQSALQALAKVKAIADQASHPLGKSTGVQSILGRDLTGLATNENVDQMGQSIASGYWRRMVDALDAMRTKAIGLTQDTEIARKTVAAIMGEASDDPAVRTFARQLQEVFEDIRVQFNKAGGHILKREGWFPMSHSALHMGRAAQLLESNLNDADAWVEFVKPLLRREFITDDLGRPLQGAQLDEVLHRVYDSIVTDGAAQIDALAQGQLKMANRHRESRFLVFRDPDAWYEYNKLFGNDDIFVAITDYVTNMSNEIALMKVLGPNPEDTYKTLKALADQDIKKRGQTGIRKGMTDALWHVVSGKANQVEAPKFANFMQGLRNTLTSVRLGRAMLSAVADFAISRNVAAWNGLEFSRIMGDYVRLMNPASETDRLAAAAQLGIIESWTTRSLGGNRFGEVTGTGKTAILADVTMKATLLTQHTNALQQAVAREALHGLAVRAGMSFDEVNKIMPVRRFFSPDEWDLLRRNGVDDGFMSVEKIMASNLDDRVKRDLSRKLLTLARDFANRAVPVPDARARALTTLGQKRGSIVGEGVRAMAQFKGFPISVLMLHLFTRQQQAAQFGRTRYMAELMVGTTLMGALALQLKEISKGRDPLPMADENAARFWVRAWTQGGGAGIFGDFIQAGAQGSNRFGQSLGTTLLGPAAGVVDDVFDMTVGNALMAAGATEGEVNLGADAARVLQNYTPFLSSAWYANLVFQRAVVDQLALATDPKASEKMRRNERRIMREQNQEYWWAPGEPTPDRAPEIL